MLLLHRRSEHITYAEQMIFMASILEQTAEAVAQIQPLVYLQTYSEVQGKAMCCIIAIFCHFDAAITKVKSGKSLQVGTKGRAESTHTRGQFPLMRILASIVKGILRIEHVPSQILAKTVLCTAAQFQLTADTALYSPCQAFLLLSHHCGATHESHYHQSQKFLHNVVWVYYVTNTKLLLFLFTAIN